MTKCKVCRSEFVRRSMSHKLCGAEACGITWAERIAQDRIRKEVRDERRQDAAARLKLKTWREWVAEAQAAFNRYIRARDSGKPCISSGRLPTSGKSNEFDAGHYRSVGSAPHLRFCESNCHGQSKHDNRHLAGNHADYRVGLIARIGLEAVEALEADQTPRKYSIDDLKRLKAEYNRRARELEKNLGH